MLMPLFILEMSIPLQYVIIIRHCPDRLYTVNIFLVDTLGLGIKGIFMKIVLSHYFINLLERIENSMPIDIVLPFHVDIFIYKAVEHAKSLELSTQDEED